MIQHKNKINLINWELVSVNPNDKTWNWKDIFCFWGINIQSVIAFSLIASLYLVYDLNVAVIFLGSLIMLLVYLILYLSGSITEPGFTTIILIQLLFFGLIMFIIGILSIYVGFILDEVKKRPTYIVDDE